LSAAQPTYGFVCVNLRRVLCFIRICPCKNTINHISYKFIYITFYNLKTDGTHQLPVYSDDVSLLGDNIDTIKKNMETLIDASKEVGLVVNTEKTKYMLLSGH
jgi:hypothetical protein